VMPCLACLCLDFWASALSQQLARFARGEHREGRGIPGKLHRLQGLDRPRPQLGLVGRRRREQPLEGSCSPRCSCWVLWAPAARFVWAPRPKSKQLCVVASYWAKSSRPRRSSDHLGAPRVEPSSLLGLRGLHLRGAPSGAGRGRVLGFPGKPRPVQSLDLTGSHGWFLPRSTGQSPWLRIAEDVRVLGSLLSGGAAI
jgi:hypothetical protein